LDAAFLPAEDTIADPIGVNELGELVIVGVSAAIADACSTPSAAASAICPSWWKSCCKRGDRTSENSEERRETS
jgi:hypothetical protein